MGRLRVGVVAAAVSLVLAALPAGAQDTTRCFFGGTAGTSRVVRLDLSEGSDFLNLIHTMNRPPRATGPESWHLGVGVFVIDEATSEVVAHRVENLGTNPRRLVIESNGQRAAETPVPGPDTPFLHSDLQSRVFGLPPGTYLVAAFGSDGSGALPNDQWGGEVEVAGDHDCQVVGSGELLDVNHSDFTGGTNVSTPAGAVVEGASLTRELAHDLVVGFVDAGVQGAGEAAVAHQHPGGLAEVTEAIVPFAAPGGIHTWTATLQGPGALASVVALGIDLS